jgi:hypothetical protein
MCYVLLAEALADEHPAEAERLFQLIDDSSDVRFSEHKNEIALRLCRPMAKTDPERARRLIAALKTPREQACAWALMALGRADRDKAAARSALAESIRLIDGLSGPPNMAELANRPVEVAGNPAASILPIVERVAPERLEEVFWKAVALMHKADITQTPTFLARYDRQVADALMQAVRARPRDSDAEFAYLRMVIRAKAVVDPRGAVAMFEALPPFGPDSSARRIRMLDQARDDLITGLVAPIDETWKEVWRRAGIPIDKARFP